MHLRATLVRALATLAAVAWTALAAGGVAIGMFAAADTRCGSTTARVDMTGGWWVIGTVVIWMAPFGLWALLSRARTALLVAGTTGVVAAVVVVWMFTHPVRFCW